MAIISISDSQVNGADEVLVADSNSKIPAVDGSQITILSATNVATGTIASARLDTGTTANKLVLLDGSGNLPAVDASLLTGLSSATISASDPTISTNPSGGVGTEWNNSTSGEMYICTDATAGANVWKNVGDGTSILHRLWYGSRGLWGGGNIPGGTHSNVIDYVTISTTGNATDFGDFINQAENVSGCCSNRIRGVWAGGQQSGNVDTIQYVTIATTGNAGDFGDLTAAKMSMGACSDGARGVFGSGLIGSTVQDVIEYITIVTTGNGTDFGDLTQARQRALACSDGTRGIFGGGHVSQVVNTMDYITIATTGNATDFGDFNTAMSGAGSSSSQTRGVWGGGSPNINAAPTSDEIQYVTISSLGNAIDFGNLTGDRNWLGACSDGTRGIWGGGGDSTFSNIIDYVTITTPGNATDFGDLTVARDGIGSCSGN